MKKKSNNNSNHYRQLKLSGQPKRASMLSEKFISGLVNYTIAIVIVMAAGLLYRKGPWSGFPLPWLFNMRHPDIGRLALSFVITAVIVVGCDFLAKLIILLREPRLKVNTKEPDFVSEYNRTDFRTSYEPEEESFNDDSDNSDTDDIQEAALDTYTASEQYIDSDYEPVDDNDAAAAISLEMIKEARSKLLGSKSSKKGLSQKELEDKKKDSSAAALLIIGIAIAVIFSVFNGLMEDDSDDYYSPDDEIVWDADGEPDSIENAANNACEQLFDGLRTDDYDYFDEFANDNDEASELIELTGWDTVYYEEIYSFIDDNENYVLKRYSVMDDYGNNYILAAYMDIGKPDEGYECYLSGVALISEDDLNSGREKVSDADNISNEEYEKFFMDKIINVGTVSIDEVHILFRSDDNGQSLTGLEA